MTATRPRVLVTCPPMLGLMNEFVPIFEAAGVEGVKASVTQTMSEEELMTQLPAFDGWIIGDDPATRRVFAAGHAGRLRAAVKWGVGVDNVDFAAAREFGIQVVNTPGVFGQEVADIAMGYVIGLARETFFIDRAIRQENAWPKPAGISLSGKTVGLIGFGDIGRQTAKRCLAADMRVIAYDPAYQPVASLPVETAGWPDRIEEADFLIFTCPLNDATRGMFNEKLLPRLKRGVRIVNVGRGPLITEVALLKGLRDGTVHSAALDVFEVEPLVPDSPLRAFPGCIFGSHNASNTVDAVRRVSKLAISLLLEQFSHQPSGTT
jgi:D-3-phosphoglycerate dehydrogenase / 2-oxoglutarate reductase